MRGAKARLDREVELGKFIAWNAALLPYLKKTPQLEEFLDGGREKPPPRRQTPEEMLLIARCWDAALRKAKPNAG